FDGQDRQLRLLHLSAGTADAQPKQVLAAHGLVGARLKREAGLPGMREFGEVIADIRPFESEFRVPDLLAVERHLDRMCRRRAYRPALENDAAGGRQRDLVTMVMEGALVRGRRRRRKLRYLDLGRDL